MPLIGPLVGQAPVDAVPDECQLDDLHREANEITAMIVASIRTSRSTGGP